MTTRETLAVRLRSQALNGGWTNDKNTLAILDELDAAQGNADANYAYLQKAEAEIARLRAQLKSARKVIEQARNSRATDFANSEYPGWATRADTWLNENKEPTP